MRSVWLVAAILPLVAGCATGPNNAVKTSSLTGDKVIMFEQSDRMPKDVLLAVNKDKGPVANMAMALPPEVIAKVIEELLKITPELAKTYSEERMNNALIQRRMLFKGYKGDELKDVERIIRAMQPCIEFVTPRPVEK